MNARVVIWLELLVEALAKARATLACFGIDEPDLTAAIDAALAEADALKHRAILPS